MSVFRGFVNEEGRFALDYPEPFRRYVAAKFKGCEVDVEVHKRGSRRTARQNRAYHALLTPWAREEGHRIEDLKADCLRAVFGEREVVDVVTGEVRKALQEPHTSTLTVAQFAELIERTVELAAGCGVLLELPDEHKARKKQEARQTRRQAA